MAQWGLEKWRASETGASASHTQLLVTRWRVAVELSEVLIFFKKIKTRQNKTDFYVIIPDF